jgi:Zn-dependent protease with chaperone function
VENAAMPFFLLLLLALACFPERWPQPLAWIGVADGDPWLFAGLTGGGVLMLVVTAALIAVLTRRQLRCDPLRREPILHRFSLLRHYHQVALYLFFELAVFVLGWGWTVQTWLTPARSGILLPGAELLILLPYLLPLVIAWFFYYDAEKAARASDPGAEIQRPLLGRLAYVRFHLRQDLTLIAAPLALLLANKGLRRALPSAEYDRLFAVLSIGLLALIFVGLPWVLRLGLGLRPLVAGPIRERLERCAERLHFRCSNILFWDTRGAIANAMVAGIVPQLRYVILTDRLLNELTPDEVEAVFGHEVGHVKHRHMPFYMSFLILSVIAGAGLWGLAVHYVMPSPAVARPEPAFATADPDLWPWRGPEFAWREQASVWREPGIVVPQPAVAVPENDWDLEVVPLFALAGTYIFVVFGFLSRRCERQADVFGCRAVSCLRGDCVGHAPDQALAPRGQGLCPTGIRTFIEALEKVARVNCINRSRPGWLQSWQHSTIARRVEFLQRVLADPTLEPRFQRTVGLVKWGLFLALAAVLFLLGTKLGWRHLGL